MLQQQTTWLAEQLPTQQLNYRSCQIDRGEVTPHAIGLALGLIVAFCLLRVINGWLYGVNAGDPLTFVSVLALLLIVATGATSLPAWQAARLDPVVGRRRE